MQQHVRKFYSFKSSIGTGAAQLTNVKSKDIANEKNANDGQQNAQAARHSGLAPSSGY